MDWATTLTAGAFLAIATALAALWVRNRARLRQATAASAGRRPHSPHPEQPPTIDGVKRHEPDEKVRLLAWALQSANDCVSITDSSDCILYVNDAFLRTYEYGQGELLGQHISIVRAKNDLRFVHGNAADGTRGKGWRRTLWNRSRSGRVFPISLTTSAVRDDEGRIVAAIGIARDMTREVETEEALRRTEMRYRAVVENANDVIFTVDREGHCLSMNQAGRKLTGYVAEDARGIHLSQLVAPHHVGFARQQLERVLAGEDVPAFELAITNRHGRLLTLELAVHALPGDGGPIGVQGIARDITARKDLEDQLRQAQKVESIGRMPAAAFESSADAVPGAAATGSETILFVEDDESIRTLGTRMLRLRGFSVLPARHAAEALQLAADRDRRIDLLVTDIVLPGLSGRDLAARMVQKRPNLKVLYTSGYSDEVIAQCDLQVNAPGFVRKPYSPDALIAQIRALLASSHS